jgi:hypothetical protein
MALCTPALEAARSLVRLIADTPPDSPRSSVLGHWAIFWRGDTHSVRARRWMDAIRQELARVGRHTLAWATHRSGLAIIVRGQGEHDEDDLWAVVVSAAYDATADFGGGVTTELPGRDWRAMLAWVQSHLAGDNSRATAA